MEESVALDVDTSSIPDYEGIDYDEYSSKSLLVMNTDGSNFGKVIIIIANRNACIDGHKRLGKDDVSIVVLAKSLQ